jgi:hypothetical protein
VAGTPLRRASCLGLFVFLALFLPLRLLRAGAEQSLWIDETASLMLASHPVAVILDQCAVDTNPPGYFLALKAWLKLGKLILGSPGILWARALGTLAWTLGAILVWWLGRSLLPHGANLLLVSVAGSAFAAVAAQDARGYCLAVPALAAALLLILDLYAQPERAVRAQAARWSLTGLLLALALWSHLLSAIVFVCLALLFACLAARRRTGAFLGCGTAAFLAAGLSFLPWSLAVISAIGSLSASAATWMTPATVPNLLAVFYYWFPFGRVAGPGRLLLDALGIASLLLPVAAALLARRTRRASRPVLLFGALAGLGVAFAFVVSLWLLQRFGLMTVFFAPRYPALAAELWAAGLALLVLWAAAGADWPQPIAWLCLAPWLVASLAGQLLALQVERRGGLEEMRAHFAPFLPGAGKALYVMPSELLPYYRETFRDFRLRPIESLPCELATMEHATVLDVNFWHVLDRPRDLIARTLLERAPLAASRQAASFPDSRHDYAIYRLRGIDHAAARALCARGLAPTARPIPPAAAAVALPEAQEYQRGWSFPEVAPDLTIRRWASAPASELTFDRALPPGRYLLHLAGYNPPYPLTPAKVTVQPPEGVPQVERLPEGEFALAVPFDLTARHGPLRVGLSRATWSPKTATGAPDTRVLSLLLEYAWVERRS